MGKSQRSGIQEPKATTLPLTSEERDDPVSA